jgi:hypothetical protein
MALCRKGTLHCCKVISRKGAVLFRKGSVHGYNGNQSQRCSVAKALSERRSAHLQRQLVAKERSVAKALCRKDALSERRSIGKALCRKGALSERRLVTKVIGCKGALFQSHSVAKALSHKCALHCSHHAEGLVNPKVRTKIFGY